MKKNLKFIVLVVFAFIVGLNVYKAQVDVKLSDTQLRNVEALANDEGGDASVIYAWSKEISCEGWGTGSYRVCQKNGPGNTCHDPGDTTCDCGRNC